MIPNIDENILINIIDDTANKAKLTPAFILVEIDIKKQLIYQANSKLTQYNKAFSVALVSSNLILLSYFFIFLYFHFLLINENK